MWALIDGGKGATFHLEWKADGKHGWQWSYNEGVKDDLWVSIETEKAVTKLEKELGLPLTWPHYDSAT